MEDFIVLKLLIIYCKDRVQAGNVPVYVDFCKLFTEQQILLQSAPPVRRAWKQTSRGVLVTIV